MKTLTICGSMKYEKEMPIIAFKLETYIGESVREEIRYAKEHGKEIIMHSSFETA